MRRYLDSWSFWVTVAFFSLVIFNALFTYTLVKRENRRSETVDVRLEEGLISACKRGNAIRLKIGLTPISDCEGLIRSATGKS